MLIYLLSKIIIISIHAPTRGATVTNVRNKMEVKISIHAPTRGATSLIYNRPGIPDNFNPRSHKGSDRWETVQAVVGAISIHAPTRGATENTREQKLIKWISIHAPTRGATEVDFTRCNALTNFNPRSHKGSDEGVEDLLDFIEISIHAPTRGATAGLVVALITL